MLSTFGVIKTNFNALSHAVSGIIILHIHFSFYGAEINIGALPYLPYWGDGEKVDASDTAEPSCLGPDCEMTKAIAYALNFTFRVPAADSWTQVSLPMSEGGGHARCHL